MLKQQQKIVELNVQYIIWKGISVLKRRGISYTKEPCILYTPTKKYPKLS